MCDPNVWGAKLQAATWKRASPKHSLVYYLPHFLLLRSSKTYSFKLLLAQTLMPTSSSLIGNQVFYILRGFFSSVTWIMFPDTELYCQIISALQPLIAHKSSLEPLTLGP